LDRRFVEGVDPDLPNSDRFAQIDVGEDHRAQVTGDPRSEYSGTVTVAIDDEFAAANSSER
jgi:hypothetical protein